MSDFFYDLGSQFYQNFIEADRWRRYLDGLGISFTVTIGALALGIVLGVLVAIVRSSYEQKQTKKAAG